MKKQKKKKPGKSFYLVVYEDHRAEIFKSLLAVQNYLSAEAEFEDLTPSDVEDLYRIYEVKREVKFTADETVQLSIDFINK